MVLEFEGSWHSPLALEEPPEQPHWPHLLLQMLVADQQSLGTGYKLEPRFPTKEKHKMLVPHRHSALLDGHCLMRVRSLGRLVGRWESVAFLYTYYIRKVGRLNWGRNRSHGCQYSYDRSCSKWACCILFAKTLEMMTLSRFCRYQDVMQ